MNTRQIILPALAGLAITFTAAEPANAIRRVAPVPEVGRHVFQAELGFSGSLEDVSGGGEEAWSVGWTYHADKVFGLGITAGGNSPEDFAGLLAINFVEYPGNFTSKFTYLTGTAHVRAPTRAGWIPRLQAGFGLYRTEFKFTEIGGSLRLEDEDDRFGMFFGGGVDYLVSENLSLGIVGNYHFTSVDDRSPLSAPLDEWFQTWDIKAVVSFYTR